LNVGDVEAAHLYDTKSIVDLLEIALRRGKPFDRPTLSRAAVERAAARAREHPRELVDVPRRIRIGSLSRPWDMFSFDRMSIASDPIPSGVGGWVGSMFTIGAESRSPASVVANLAVALSVLGADEEQLVRSCESSSRNKGAYTMVISCIPGART
jgi:hypothetical protein